MRTFSSKYSVWQPFTENVFLSPLSPILKQSSKEKSVTHWYEKNRKPMKIYHFLDRRLYILTNLYHRQNAIVQPKMKISNRNLGSVYSPRTLPYFFKFYWRMQHNTNKDFIKITCNIVCFIFMYLCRKNYKA